MVLSRCHTLPAILAVALMQTRALCRCVFCTKMRCTKLQMKFLGSWLTPWSKALPCPCEIWLDWIECGYRKATVTHTTTHYSHDEQKSISDHLEPRGKWASVAVMSAWTSLAILFSPVFFWTPLDFCGWKFQEIDIFWKKIIQALWQQQPCFGQRDHAFPHIVYRLIEALDLYLYGTDWIFAWMCRCIVHFKGELKSYF